MIQSGGILADLLPAIPQAIFLPWVEAIKRGVKRGVTLAKNAALELPWKSTRLYGYKGMNELKKKFASSKSSGRALIKWNNAIKDIIKVISSLENRGILLKETTEKVSSQERGFLKFVRPLLSASLPLIQNVLTPLAKSVLVPLS